MLSKVFSFFNLRQSTHLLFALAPWSLIKLAFITALTLSFAFVPQKAWSQNDWGLALNEDQMNKALDLYVEKLPTVMEQSIDNIHLFTQALAFAKTRFEEIKQSTHGDLELADDIFRQEIDQRNLVYVDEKLGTAEFTNIDNSPIIRIVDKLGSVIVFIHAQYVKKDSKHLTQYISRQHSVAGKNGRDVVIVWHDDNKILSAQDHIKPSPLSLSYWQSYLSAVYKPATFDSICFGIISGFAQATLTGIMGFVQHGFSSHVAVMAASVFGFGTIIGSYASTYRNVVFYSDSKISQILKQSVLSYAFAYMVFSINQSALGDVNHVMSITEYMGLIINILLSSSAKNEFSQWAKIKDLERVDVKNYAAKIPILNKVFHFSERDINYQFKVQLTTQAIRTADLLGYQISIPTPMGVYSVDFGKVVLWLSAPIVHFSVKNWANKNYPDTAKKLGLDIESQFAFKEFFKRLTSQFTLKPSSWQAFITHKFVDHQTRSVKETYVKALAKYIDKNYANKEFPDLNLPKSLGPLRCQDLSL